MAKMIQFTSAPTQIIKSPSLW